MNTRTTLAAVALALATVPAAAYLTTTPPVDGHGTAPSLAFRYDGVDLRWTPDAWRFTRQADGTCLALNFDIHFAGGQPDSVETIRACNAAHFTPDLPLDPCAGATWYVYRGPHVTAPHGPAMVASGTWRACGTPSA